VTDNAVLAILNFAVEVGAYELNAGSVEDIPSDRRCLEATRIVDAAREAKKQMRATPIARVIIAMAGVMEDASAKRLSNAAVPA
jgi:hypothetical protein